MNARRRTKPDGLPNRVYRKGPSYYWVRHTDGKWIRLCSVTDGETRMLERLAEEKRKIEVDATERTMSRLVAIYITKHAADYAESYRDEWRRRGETIRTAFRNFEIEQVDAAACEDFLTENWHDKPTAQKAMKAWLSGFFSWAVRRKHLQVNPVREVKVKKPPRRTVYITPAHFVAIRNALALAADGKKTPTGPMMQVFVDLCYLTCQRSTEIRNLRWADIDWDARLIRFVPTKTENSSGEAVDWPITPEIEAVLRRAKKLEPIGGEYIVRDKHGNPKTTAACRDAWNDAKARAGLATAKYTVKDIRAQALTDAKKAGYDIEALQVASAHTDRSTTEGYIKQREVPISTVHLKLPVT
ncbi:tyrosine-type recombinase/integrase [Ralstonia pseudosolanacearum]|uniref:tyrosine-type recombinase/integrase n=1 Tax=Ralstonia pseudosolanacearum TaxID=1310165 RepID=UPI001FF7C16F|nr:tyrosine-type recombinase/integrase [Ralstonia pseudosolanacearum]